MPRLGSQEVELVQNEDLAPALHRRQRSQTDDLRLGLVDGRADPVDLPHVRVLTGAARRASRPSASPEGSTTSPAKASGLELRASRRSNEEVGVDRILRRRGQERDRGRLPHDRSPDAVVTVHE